MSTDTTTPAADFAFNEKRKWQIALRRYIIEGKKSSAYAPYFGLDTARFKQWIALQFTPGMSWENFSTAWQFDHVVPVALFNLANEEDLRLCWHFTNIRAEAVGQPKLHLAAARQYFDGLQTFHTTCAAMCGKIDALLAQPHPAPPALQQFLQQNQSELTQLADFSPYEFDQLNSGATMEHILAERALLNRFG